MTVHAAVFEFTTAIPECKMPQGRALPDKYYRYSWATKIKSTDSIVGGEAEKKFDNPDDRTHLSHELIKSDINNDGWCDWLVNSSFPLSNGGDRDSINTFYLGQSKGWRRIGPELRGGSNSPDGLGWNKFFEQKKLFDFFENASFLYEKNERKTYMLGVFGERHSSQLLKPGYHIYVWDKQRNTLIELDKWTDENAPGAQAYAYFKKNGAFLGLSDQPLEKFDMDSEKKELLAEQGKLIPICNRTQVPIEYKTRCGSARENFPKRFTESYSIRK
jgi:hypothetical protein